MYTPDLYGLNRQVNTYSGKALRIIECRCLYTSSFDRQLQEVWLAKLMVTGLVPCLRGTVISNSCRKKETFSIKA